MTIQWFTIVAQIINFLVLVYLLQRFLYGPIVNAMDERQAKIAQRMQEAEDKRRQADEEAAAYRRKKNEMDEQREQMLAEMRKEVEERRQALLQEIRKDINEREQLWHHALNREQEYFLQNLRRQASQQFYAVAERALADVADATLNAQAVRAFLRHIQELDNEAWQAFVRSIRTADQPIVVQSAFDLSAELRKQIEDTLQGLVEDRIELRFETDAGLIAGVQLQANHHIAAWHLDEYLETLAGRTQATLEAEIQGENKH